MEKVFKKYNDIENSYRQAFIDKIVINGFSNELFHVEEKIHGANFQFNVDSNGITAGKRTAFISENEGFYSYKLVVEQYSEAILKLKNEVFPNHNIIVYGELFGGSYPHNDVPNDSRYAKVQKEIFYAPFEDFICFDIFVYNDNTDEHHYITKTERETLCNKYGIKSAVSLFSGTLESCLNYPNAFLTTIPKLYGLPDIENNICEGVVIRPEHDLRMKSGERPIIKNKNEKFTEKKCSGKIPKIAKDVPEHIVTMLNNIDEYINENRLNAMISKVGELKNTDFGLYIQLFSKDVYADFFKDYSEEFKTWEKADQKNFQKEVNQMVVTFLKENLLTKI